MTVTGTVEWLIYEADGDIHIRVKVDSAYSYMINNYNTLYQYGNLVVEIICVTTITYTAAEASCKDFINTVYIPNRGERVSVTGSFVTDNVHGWNEIHPATTITFIDAVEDLKADMNSINSLQVFPNPATTEVNFKFNQPPSSPVFISITDELGRNAGQYQLFKTQQLQINTSYLPNGNYYYSISKGNKILKTGKFVIAHSSK